MIDHSQNVGMSSATDLADRLSKIELSPTSSGNAKVSKERDGHFLSFEFPAMELLPSGFAPRIERPANIEQRNRPNRDTLAVSSCTDFFTVLKEYSASVFLTRFDNDNCGKLLRAVDLLRKHAGRSTLYMVSFSMLNNAAFYNSLIYRLQLETFSKNENAPKHVQEFALDEEEYGRLTAYANEEEWISVLYNLVTRASDRAYFEVRDRLQEVLGDDFVAYDDLLWESVWHTRPARCAEELFVACLKPISAEDERNLRSQGDAKFNLRLPCGHRVYIRKIEIAALTTDGCLTQQCPVCHERILQDNQNEELVLRRNWEEAAGYRHGNAVWIELDQLILTSSAERKFDTEDLLDTLRASLVSLTEPRMICPRSLSPANFDNTKSVMERFERTYGGSMLTILISPFDLLESLYGLAMGAQIGRREGEIVAKTVMLPGWLEFLAKWLTRSVNFLTERRCSDRDCRLAGVHEHDGRLYYRDGNVLDDEEDPEEGMSDLRRKMEDVNMSDW